MSHTCHLVTQRGWEGDDLSVTHAIINLNHTPAQESKRGSASSWCLHCACHHHRVASGTAPALLHLLKAYKLSMAQSVTIDIIGFPNVSKSSLINMLKSAKVCHCISLGSPF